MTGPERAGDAVAEVEAILDLHRVDKSGTCAPGRCGWRGNADGPVIAFLAEHRAHVAAQIAPLLDQARAEGATDLDYWIETWKVAANSVLRLQGDVEAAHAERDRLRAAVKALAEPGDPTVRMDAYYYGFDRTGVGIIDAILSAVAAAGKGYHHTESWQDEGYGDDKRSHEDRIQDAANTAAAALRAVLADADNEAGA